MKILFILILLFSSTNVFSQFTNANKEDGSLRNRTSMMLKKAPRISLSEYFLDNDWSMGEVHLRDKEITERLDKVFIKLDVKNQILNLKFDDEVKVADYTKVDYFFYKGDKYVSSSYLLEPSLKLFFKVHFSLAKQIYYLSSTTVKVANPSNGSKSLGLETSQKVLKEEKYFLFINQKIYPKAKFKGKRIYNLFGKHKMDLINYSKKNKLNPRNKEDLKKILSEYQRIQNS